MKSSESPMSRRIDRGHVELACYLAAAVFFAGWALLGHAGRLQKPPAKHSPVVMQTSGPAQKPLATRPIEQMQVGDRTLGENPQRDQVDTSLPEPDPGTWRKVSLHLVKQSGRSLWVDFLRPIAWFAENGVTAGGDVWLDLPEMGAVGNAEVLSVEPCPRIKPGKGHVVTGKFKHEAADNLVQLRLEGQPEATGVTDNHPYWSEDRKDFVKAGELRKGERVKSVTGSVRVESVSRLAYQGFVHNLEVHGEHVYRVGTLAALVHNACFRISTIAPDWITKGFHVHVGNVELSVRAGVNGVIEFSSIFSSTRSGPLRAAVRSMIRDIESVANRRALYNAAERAREYLRGANTPLSLERADQLTLLMQALENLGL